jgi:hypothetical protein
LLVMIFGSYVASGITARSNSDTAARALLTENCDCSVLELTRALLSRHRWRRNEDDMRNRR